MSKVARSVVAVLFLALMAPGLGGKPKGGAQNGLPKVSELPADLPKSTLKQDGQAGAVRATAQHLKVAVTKICPQCGGRGTIQTPGQGPGLQRPVENKCDKCGGSGRIPNDPEQIDVAALAVVTAIVRMAPDAANADTALSQAYESITDNILKSEKNFVTVQEKSAAMLAQAKPPVDKLVMFKAIFAGEIPDPTESDKHIYILRVAHKKQVIAVVAPKQADPPLEGGRALVAGVIAGSVDANTGGKSKEPVIIIEHGFLISPNVNQGWWTRE